MSKTPWITREILNSRKIKIKLYKKFIKSPNKTNETAYKSFQNKFNKIKKAAKKKYYSEELEKHKGNLRISWKIINEIINKNKTKSDMPYVFKDNDKIVTDHIEIAKKFNDYFVNIQTVGPNLAEKIPVNKIVFTSYLEDSNINSIFVSTGFCEVVDTMLSSA